MLQPRGYENNEKMAGELAETADTYGLHRFADGRPAKSRFADRGRFGMAA